MKEVCSIDILISLETKNRVSVNKTSAEVPSHIILVCSGWSRQWLNSLILFRNVLMVLSTLLFVLHLNVFGFSQVVIFHHPPLSHTHWLTWFLCLVSEGKSEALMAGMDCWNVIVRRSSRVCEQTMRFFLAYMTKPPKHELVGSCALNSGRNFSLSTVTVQGISDLPSSAATWLSMLSLYS